MAKRFEDFINYYGVKKPKKRIFDFLSTLALSLLWIVSGIYAALGGFIRNSCADY